jgi:hypothetical protein
MIHPHCVHSCTSDCRHNGCNCECGEFHDHYEPVTDETIAEIAADIDTYFEKVTIKEGSILKPKK